MNKGAVVVCDPGVDDFLALLVLAGVGNPPRAIVGTGGNVGADLAYRNATRTLTLLGIDCPVGKGVDSALAGPYPVVGEPFHGFDGLGGIGSFLAAHPVVDELLDPIDLIEDQILATAALTLVARALDAGRHITEIVWMGGAVACGGNVTPAAEFNAWLDPEATDRVLSSGVPLSMIPLDVTRQVGLTPQDLVAMADLGRVAELAARACSHFHDRGGPMVPHDAVAAVALHNPELFQWEQRWVRCELNGHLTRGMTVVDRRSHGESSSVRVAADVNAIAVKEQILVGLSSLG